MTPPKDSRVSEMFGVIHLAPLPGAPNHQSIDAVIERAVIDAQAYVDGGFSRLIVENYGDAPFYKTKVPPETIAAMARAGTAVKAETGVSIGFNVLRNDPHAALALCAACGGEFIRVNVHTGAMVTDQGLIEGDAAHTLRLRKQLCPEVKIFADVLVKHAAPLGNMPLAQAAVDTWHRGDVDALIVSGTGTGEPTPIKDLKIVRHAVPDANILVGSGATSETLPNLLEYADGVIIGSALKTNGTIDVAKVKAFCSVL